MPSLGALEMRVLVVNSGSSSVKFELFALDGAEETLAAGLVERVGSPHARLVMRVGGPEAREVEAPDHEAALRVVLDTLADLIGAGGTGGQPDLAVVGHRVVHGGERFTEPALLTDEVVDEIRRVGVLAPVHARANLAGIEAARRVLPNVPQVAVFDTAFHSTLPPRAYTYALPRELASACGIRRYGFHGTSHEYVAARAAELLGRPLETLDLITMHLGNGASATAVHRGRSIDTSMGLTPLEGLVMGTRSGDIDPAVPELIGQLTERTNEEVSHLLNFESGILGMCGVSDMRQVHALAEEGDEAAELALEVFCYRAKKYVGAYAAALGRLDALVFTAGIGENDAIVRARICEGLEFLGIQIDDVANREFATVERLVSPPGCAVPVLVIPTHEEREIARAALACVAGR
jgi:acetate kinase